MGQNQKSKIQAADQGMIHRQQHTEQPEFNNEGEVDQNAEQCHDTCHLPAKLTDKKTIELSNQLLESENVCLKKTVAPNSQDCLSRWVPNRKDITSITTKVDSENPQMVQKKIVTTNSKARQSSIDCSAVTSQKKGSIVQSYKGKESEIGCGKDR
ncbi:hypothetical protein Tco_0616135 [Tanacetum coccineum]